MTARPPNARDLAARVLVRVAREGAYAAAALDGEIARAVQLDDKERGLATEIVYGSLRVRPWLESRLQAYAKKPLSKLDPRVLAQLVVAAYQLFFLERVPSFAAVNEAVGAVRASKGREVGAFANAVLRKVAAEASKAPGDMRAAVVLSTPAWMRSSLERSLGDEGARAFLEAALEAPPIGVRVQNANERDAWVEKLRAASPAARIEPGKVSPYGILVRGAGRPQLLPGWNEGAWSIQEEGSQLVALATGAAPGETVLDACAGRGNKTGLLAELVGPAGAVDAADLHASKLERLAIELERIHVRERATYAVDWSVGSGGVTGAYDRVLVDAPCTGTGTLRRRPELLARRSAADVSELAALQVTIASRAADHVRPGGVLLYAVCSVLREEGEEVVERLCTARADLEAIPFPSAAARRVAPREDCSAMRLVPNVHGTDGYFLAALRKRSERG